MTKPKMIIGTLTVVLALGVAAISATSAVAATASWMVAGTNLTGSAPIATATKTDENFVLKAGSTGIVITCEVLEVESGKITAPNKDSASSLVFKKCKGSTVCPIANETIRTKPILSEATLEGTLAANITFTPETGTVFTEVTFEGAECGLSGIQPITGKAKALSPTGQDERTLQLLTPTVTEASGELKVGSSAASLKGSALLELESHKTWSFL